MSRLSSWLRSALAAALLLGCASSPEPAGPGSAAGGLHELTRSNAFLYEVSRPGSRRVDLYLLGSLHVLDQPLRLGDGLRRDFESADALVLELDLRKLDMATMAELMVRYGLLGPGEELDYLIGPETKRLLTRRIEQPDFSVQERVAALRMRPWAIHTLLLEKQVSASGVEPAWGVDFFFAQQWPADAPVLELESADEQLFALSSLSDDAAEALLLSVLQEEGGGGADAVLRMVAAWKSGDERAVAAILAEESAAHPELREALFTARDERMAETLAELLEEDPDRVLFAVIGAGHVVGEGAVPAILRREGFRVERAR